MKKMFIFGMVLCNIYAPGPKDAQSGIKAKQPFTEEVSTQTAPIAAASGRSSPPDAFAPDVSNDDYKTVPSEAGINDDFNTVDDTVMTAEASDSGSVSAYSTVQSFCGCGNGAAAAAGGKFILPNNVFVFSNKAAAAAAEEAAASGRFSPPDAFVCGNEAEAANVALLAGDLARHAIIESMLSGDNGELQEVSDEAIEECMSSQYDPRNADVLPLNSINIVASFLQDSRALRFACRSYFSVCLGASLYSLQKLIKEVHEIDIRTEVYRRKAIRDIAGYEKEQVNGKNMCCQIYQELLLIDYGQKKDDMRFARIEKYKMGESKYLLDCRRTPTVTVPEYLMHKIDCVDLQEIYEWAFTGDDKEMMKRCLRVNSSSRFRIFVGDLARYAIVKSMRRRGVESVSNEEIKECMSHQCYPSKAYVLPLDLINTVASFLQDSRALRFACRSYFSVFLGESLYRLKNQEVNKVKGSSIKIYQELLLVGSGERKEFNSEYLLNHYESTGVALPEYLLGKMYPGDVTKMYAIACKKNEKQTIKMLQHNGTFFPSFRILEIYEKAVHHTDEEVIEICAKEAYEKCAMSTNDGLNEGMLRYKHKVQYIMRSKDIVLLMQLPQFLVHEVLFTAMQEADFETIAVFMNCDKLLSTLRGGLRKFMQGYKSLYNKYGVVYFYTTINSVYDRKSTCYAGKKSYVYKHELYDGAKSGEYFVKNGRNA